MTLIPNDYYFTEVEVKLTQQEIESIIECLERESYNVFVFCEYDKIIKKLRRENESK